MEMNAYSLVVKTTVTLHLRDGKTVPAAMWQFNATTTATKVIEQIKLWGGVWAGDANNLRWYYREALTSVEFQRLNGDSTK